MTAGDAGLQVLGRLEMSASPSAAFGVECPARHSAFSMDFIFHFREPARAAPAMCIAGGDCCREHLPHLPVPPLLAAWRPRISSGARLLSRRICASASPTFGFSPVSLPAVGRCWLLLPLHTTAALLHGSQAGPFTATRACLEAHGSRRQPSSARQVLLLSRRATGALLFGSPRRCLPSHGLTCDVPPSRSPCHAQHSR